MRPDVVLMDLGISSLQLDNWERGFSYAYDAPLDMRMDTEQALSALEVVNEWPAERLATILREYGEERHARSIAAEIARRRPLRPPPSWSTRSATRSRPPTASAAAIRPSAPSRRSGSPSTPSSTRSTAAWRRRGRCWRPAAGSARSPSTRSRTAGSSASSPIAPAAASARPSSRSASAATSPRPSSSRAARVQPVGGRDRAQSALALGPAARGAQARRRRKFPLRRRNPAG